VTALELSIAIAIVGIGSCVQASLGFGLGLLAAPVLAIVDERLVPGPLLMIALVLTLLVARRERGGLDWPGVKWAVIGRVPGSVLGTIAVVALSERLLIVVFALLVLAAVLLSAAGWKVTPTVPTLFTAGMASGLMGSITSIGGPPMAIAYQHRSGPELRATLALFFVFGSALSIVLLTMAGEISGSDVRLAAVLIPPMIVGHLVARHASRWLDRGFVRPAILWFSGGASVALLVFELAA
jgi:uncharacterized membrane protein YfcA